jgi:hypothetical protein
MVSVLYTEVQIVWVTLISIFFFKEIVVIWVSTKYYCFGAKMTTQEMSAEISEIKSRKKTRTSVKRVT